MYFIHDHTYYLRYRTIRPLNLYHTYFFLLDTNDVAEGEIELVLDTNDVREGEIKLKTLGACITYKSFGRML